MKYSPKTLLKLLDKIYIFFYPLCRYISYNLLLHYTLKQREGFWFIIWIKTPVCVCNHNSITVKQTNNHKHTLCITSTYNNITSPHFLINCTAATGCLIYNLNLLTRQWKVNQWLYSLITLMSKYLGKSFANIRCQITRMGQVQN